MYSHPQDSLADLVRRWNGHDEEALSQLVDLLYDDLRQIAHAHLRLERAEHTLSTTAVVHETYAQLAAGGGPEVVASSSRPRFSA